MEKKLNPSVRLPIPIILLLLNKVVEICRLMFPLSHFQLYYEDSKEADDLINRLANISPDGVIVVTEDADALLNIKVKLTYSSRFKRFTGSGDLFSSFNSYAFSVVYALRCDNVVKTKGAVYLI